MSTRPMRFAFLGSCLIACGLAPTLEALGTCPSWPEPLYQGQVVTGPNGEGVLRAAFRTAVADADARFFLAAPVVCMHDEVRNALEVGLNGVNVRKSACSDKLIQVSLRPAGGPDNQLVSRLHAEGPGVAADVTVVARLAPGGTCNAPPVADAGGDQTHPVGTTVTLDGSGSTDRDGDPLTYAWSFESLPVGSAALLSDAASVSPSFTIDLPGDYVLELIVHDGQVASAPDTVTVSTVNSAPVADAGRDQTVALGSTVTLDGSGSYDVDGDALAYAWVLTAPPGSAASLSDPAAPQPTFVADRPGSYQAELVVDDGQATSAPDVVAVDTANSLPVADAGPDQTDVPIGSTVLLDGTASFDADGDPLTFAWSLLSVPAGSTALLSDPASTSPSFGADLPGAYVAQLIVNDGQGDGAPDTVMVSVTNLPPVADAGADGSVLPGATVLLDGSASFDPESQPLSFAWLLTSVPLGSAAAVSDPTAIAPSFVADLAGVYVAQLTVDDGLLWSAPDSVVVTAERPVVGVSATDALAGEVGPDPGTFTLTRSGTLDDTLVVSFVLAGSAAPGSDYPDPGTSAAFAAGQAALEIDVIPIDDGLVEGDETVVLTIAPGAGYTVGTPSQATLTIEDNPAPVVSVVATDRSAAEPDDPGEFTISRTGDLALPLDVSFSLGGTADSGTDYVPLATTLTLPTGASSATLTVEPIDNATYEATEGVQLVLQPGLQYVVGNPSQAIVSIADDDTQVNVQASDPTAAEDGPDTGTYRITRVGQIDAPLTVFYSLSGSATPGVDYLSLPGSVTIPAGDNQVSFLLEPIDDALVEGPETARLTLTADPSYQVGALGQATVTILDDERPVVTVTVSDPDASEEGPDPGSFSVARTGPTAAELTVFLAVAGSATQGVDYESLGASVTIPAGASSAPVLVTPIDDTLLEGPEGVLLSLSADPAYVVGIPGIAALSIFDDDQAVVTIEATDPDAAELGPDTGTFTVTRTGSAGGGLTVRLAITGTASSTDYASFGTLVTMPAGQASATITVTPLADNLVENPETLTLTVIPDPNYVVGTPSVATVTIADDPPIVTIVASDPTAAEARLDPGVFVVSRTGGKLSQSLVVFFDKTGTAQNNLDYSIIGGNQSIPAGQSAATIDVLPFADNVVEGDETLTLTLTASASYLVASPGVATVAIADDPALLTLSAVDPQASEAGPDNGTFVLSRTGGKLSASLNVFFTMSGTASDGVDYQDLGGATVVRTIPAGASSVAVEIVPLPDNQVEGPETVVLTLSTRPEYVIVPPGQDTVTIADDPAVVQIVTSDPDASEQGADPGVFTVTRTGGKLSATLSVSFTRSGSATQGADYASIGTSVSFPAGVSAATVTVLPIDDALVEGPEDVILTLVPSSNYAVGTSSSATVTIADND